MAKPKGKALGKGLGALIEEQSITAASTASSASEIDVSLIDLCTTQPRKYFDDEKLEELAESIRVHGIIQPLVLAPKGGRYLIIAGERRFRAARKAGLKTVPATIKEVDDRAILELSIIENIQREDLNPLEEAQAMSMLMHEYGLTQEQLSERLSKSRSAIANAVRLLGLPEKTAGLVINKELSAGHARTLLPLSDPALIDAAAERVISSGMSVRETESYVKKLLNPSVKPEKTISSEIKNAEKELSETLATRVKISGSTSKGKISIEYFSEEQLEQLYNFLKKAGF